MDYPDWYYRLLGIAIREGREIEGADFDEDISELGEGEGDSESDGSDVACECDGEDECECHGQDECECDTEDECECDLWDDDEESVHSHTGSDADYYYELKRQRIDRKIRLRDEEQFMPEHQIVYPAYEAMLEVQNERNCPGGEERNFFRALEGRNEQIVYTAYEAMLEAQEKRDCPRLKPITGEMFNLYSVDYFDYCYSDLLYGTKYVEFYPLHPWDDDGPPDPEAAIRGHV